MHSSHKAFQTLERLLDELVGASRRLIRMSGRIAAAGLRLETIVLGDSRDADDGAVRGNVRHAGLGFHPVSST